MTVYVVTSGDYSEYGIDYVFLKKEKAEEYVRFHKGTRIEEYETSDDGYKPYNPQKCVTVTYTLVKGLDKYTVVLNSVDCYGVEGDGYKNETALNTVYKDYTLTVRRYYKADENNETIIKKTKKIGYDISAQVVDMLVNGAKPCDIRTTLNIR